MQFECEADDVTSVVGPIGCKCYPECNVPQCDLPNAFDAVDVCTFRLQRLDNSARMAVLKNSDTAIGDMSAACDFISTHGSGSDVQAGISASACAGHEALQRGHRLFGLSPDTVATLSYGIYQSALDVDQGLVSSYESKQDALIGKIADADLGDDFRQGLQELRDDVSAEMQKLDAEIQKNADRITEAEASILELHAEQLQDRGFMLYLKEELVDTTAALGKRVDLANVRMDGLDARVSTLNVSTISAVEYLADRLTYLNSSLLQEVQDLRDETDARITTLNATTLARFASVEARLDDIEKRFDADGPGFDINRDERMGKEGACAPYILLQKVLMAGPMPIPVLVKLQATATIAIDVETSQAFNAEFSFDQFFGIEEAFVQHSSTEGTTVDLVWADGEPEVTKKLELEGGVAANVTVKLGPVLTFEILGVKLELEAMLRARLLAEAAISRDEDSACISGDLTADLGLVAGGGLKVPNLANPAKLAGEACSIAVGLVCDKLSVILERPEVACAWRAITGSENDPCTDLEAGCERLQKSLQEFMPNFLGEPNFVLAEWSTLYEFGSSTSELEWCDADPDSFLNAPRTRPINNQAVGGGGNPGPAALTRVQGDSISVTNRRTV